MKNDMVSWEDLGVFLWLYKRSSDVDFDENYELVKLSRQISRVDDTIYDSLSLKKKNIVDVVRIFEFQRIWYNHMHGDFSEGFWLQKMSEKISVLKATNAEQQNLIGMAQIFSHYHAR